MPTEPISLNEEEQAMIGCLLSLAVASLAGNPQMIINCLTLLDQNAEQLEALASRFADVAKTEAAQAMFRKARISIIAQPDAPVLIS